MSCPMTVCHVNPFRSLAVAEERRAALVRELEALDASMGGLRCGQMPDQAVHAIRHMSPLEPRIQRLACAARMRSMPRPCLALG